MQILCEVYRLILKKSKFLTAVILSLAVLLPAMPVGQALAAGDIDILVNGHKLSSDVAPFLENNRTLLPFRACAEALGAEVQWVRENNSVVMTKDSATVRLYIGTNKASINGEAKVLDVKSQVKNNRTLVPLRFVGEALSCNVEWVAAENAVKITTGQNGEVIDYTNPLTEEAISAYRAEILNSINDYRIAKGIGSVALSGEYTLMSQAQSEDMAAYDYLGSDSPRNGSLEARAANAGLYLPSENAAKINLSIDGSISEAVNAWKGSYLTNAVLLQPTAGYVGIGVAASADDPNVVYVTLDVAATKGYFTSKPAVTDEAGNISLTGYAALNSVSVTLYKLTSDLEYESKEVYPAQTADGKFSLVINDLSSGRYMAKVSNDTFVFDCIK